MGPLVALALATLAAQPSFYGDAGTSEASVALGFSSGGGFAAGAGFRHFVVDRVAPGLEASYFRYGGYSQGLALASLRLVPLRLDSVALVLTGRGGRVFVSDHEDGWAVGGDAGVIFFASPNVGFELGYQVLRLLPSSFCADFESCTLHQPVLGVRIAF